MATILTIDDSPLARSVVRIALEPHGHRLHEVCDGAEGLDAAIELRPDILVCGASLPGLCAYDLARCLRSAGIPAPMIVLGHDPDLADSLIGADLGIIGVVGRPPCVEELRAGIDAAIAGGNRFAA